MVKTVCWGCTFMWGDCQRGSSGRSLPTVERGNRAMIGRLSVSYLASGRRRLRAASRKLSPHCLNLQRRPTASAGVASGPSPRPITCRRPLIPPPPAVRAPAPDATARRPSAKSPPPPGESQSPSGTFPPCATPAPAATPLPCRHAAPLAGAWQPAPGAKCRRAEASASPCAAAARSD